MLKLLLPTRIIIVTLLMACVFSALVPNTLVVNAFGIGGGMACCSGKSSGHCNIALRTRRRQPISEPMCGLKANDDEITIVAEETVTEVETPNLPAVRTMASPCGIDCCTCSVRVNQQKKPGNAPVATQSRYLLPTPFSWTGETTSFLPKAETKAEPFSPRGPPYC